MRSLGELDGSEGRLEGLEELEGRLEGEEGGELVG